MYKENVFIHFLVDHFMTLLKINLKTCQKKEKLTKQTQRRSRGFAGKQEAAFMQVSYKITVLPCLPLST